MNNPTLLSLAQASGQQKNLVYTHDLAKKSGILKTMWWQKANSGLKHFYQKATALPSGEFRGINGGVTPENVESESGVTDLMCLEAMHQVDRDLIDKYPDGLPRYIADKSPGYLFGLGQTFSRQMIYGTAANSGGFVGLQQVAKQYGQVMTTAESGSGNDYASIMAVRWALDECSGLYDEEALVNQGLVRIVKANQGEWFYKSNNGREYPIYQFSYHGYFGVQVLSSNNVAVLTGIKDANGYRPTADKIDLLLDAVLAETDGSTFLYMNRRARRLLSTLKQDKMQTGVYDTEFGLLLDTWNGVPIVVEDNLAQNEAFTL